MTILNSFGTRPENTFTLDKVIIRGLTEYANVTTNVISMDIYESLSGFIDGSFVVNDPVGLIDALKIVGDEAIDIQFRSGSGDNTKTYRKTFRLNNYTRFVAPAGNVEMVEFFFVNQAEIENKLTKKSQTFSNKTISEMVRIILSGFKSLAETDIQIEDTLYQRSYQARLQRPLDIIETIRKNAASKNNKSCDFYFYEDRDGVKFKSLGSLKGKEPEYTIVKEAQSSRMHNSGQTELITALRMYTPKGADMIELSAAGRYGARVYSHSLINKKIIIRDITEDKAIKNNPYMNAKPISEEKEIIDSDMPFNTVYITPADGYYEPDVNLPQGHLLAVKLMEQMNPKIVLAEIPGNVSLTVGDVVNLEHVSISNNFSSNAVSGKWLIGKLAHKFSLGDAEKKFTTELELITDSKVGE